MAIDLDLDAARRELEDMFASVQAQVLANTAPATPNEIQSDFDRLFKTHIQGYREALLGLALARLQNRAINIRLPYSQQGKDAFNARTLDEMVVNPFFQKHRIPSSRGPYLSMFRRDFRFEPAQRRGQRDKAAFDAFLNLIAAMESTHDKDGQYVLTSYLLYKFARLREAAEVTLSRLQRISLEQYDALLHCLLNIQSGGRLPVVIVVAAFRAIKEFFQKDWEIVFQGINVADGPTGMGGDITVKENGVVVFAAEVTERPLGRSRVIATFNTKISPNAIEDYLFFIPLETLSEDARKQARQYFAQGHEVNFIDVRAWVLSSLATIGKRGRELFNIHLLALLDDREMPRQIKVAWNECINALTSPTTEP